MATGPQEATEANQKLLLLLKHSKYLQWTLQLAFVQLLALFESPRSKQPPNMKYTFKSRISKERKNTGSPLAPTEFQETYLR